MCEACLTPPLRASHSQCGRGLRQALVIMMNRGDTHPEILSLPNFISTGFLPDVALTGVFSAPPRRGVYVVETQPLVEVVTWINLCLE